MSNHKSKVIAVVAPHPDDETLGCGGTLLRHLAFGDRVHWIIFTGISTDRGFSEESVRLRDEEISQVAESYGFAGIHRLDYPTTQLDRIPKADMVGALGSIVTNLGVHTLYVPYRNDAHTDHAAVFDACCVCAKTFRYPSVRSVRAYETLSETEYSLKPEDPGFHPNLFVDITGFLDRKLQIMSIYATEMAPFPFPRSDIALRAQAQLRGTQCGASAAEAFMVLKEIV
jgi:LmbE family N-acetylglucosaminyl deacetylase